MSQLPTENGGHSPGGSKPGSKSPAIRLAPVEGENISSRPIGTSGELRLSPTAGKGQPSATRPTTPLGYSFGFLLLMLGVCLTVLPEGVWGDWLARLGSPWATESCRWILGGMLIVAAVSFLHAKPIAVFFVGALVLLTGYTTDVMLAGEASSALDQWAGGAFAGRFLVLLSIAAAYLLHLGAEARQPLGRGVLGLAIIALAAHALVGGRIEAALAWAAPKFGPGGESVLTQWGQEFAWGCVLVLTAIGVASSRTRAIHFLNAVLLFCLAVYCVRSGMNRVVEFPTLDASLTEVSIKNVTLWRWVAAGELVLLSVVLLHQALGIGGLCVAFAIAWMVCGVNIYREFGSLEFSRVVSKALAGSMGRNGVQEPQSANPLSNMGLPVAPQSPNVTPATVTRESSESNTAGDAAHGAQTPAPITVDQPLIVREATRQIWLLLTSILAGLIGVTGARLLFRSFRLRILMFVLFWMMSMLGVVYVGHHASALGDTSWILAWTQSKLHLYACWVFFLLTMAVAGCWAFLEDECTETWLHISVYAVFAGTILSLVAVSVLIGLGGFSGLPVWTYIAIAAGQSSLAWIILMHLSIRARDEGRATSLL